jgi:hypothetical protein
MKSRWGRPAAAWKETDTMRDPNFLDRSVTAGTSLNPADARTPTPVIPSDAQIVAIVRLNLKGFDGFAETEQESWKEGMALVRFVQAILVDNRISPLRVNPRIFAEMIEEAGENLTFLTDAGCLVLDFESAWAKAVCPDGHTPLSYAFCLAEIDAWRPQFDHSFPTPSIREVATTLAAACAHLQSLNEKNGGEKSFFLSWRDAAQALGRRKQDVGQIIRNLVEIGVLRKISPKVRSEKGLATEYEYLGPLWEPHDPHDYSGSTRYTRFT